MQEERGSASSPATTGAAGPVNSAAVNATTAAAAADAAAAASIASSIAASAAAAANMPSSPFYPMLDPGLIGGFDFKDKLEAWGSLPYAASLYYPYEGPMTGYPFPHGYGMDLNGARRKNATRETTSMLKQWLSEHRKNPYPTKGEKIMLAIVTKMTLTQVSTWFANARRRLKKENKMTWSPRNRCEEDEAADAEAEKSDTNHRDSGSASPTGSHRNDRRSPHSPHRRIRDDDDSDIVDIEEDSDNEDSDHQISSHNHHHHSSKRMKLTSGSSGSPSSSPISSHMPSPFGPGLHPAAIGAGLQFPDGSRLPPGFPAFPSAHHHSHPHHAHHLAPPPPPPLPPSSSSPNAHQQRMHQQAAAIAAHQMAAAAAAFNHTSFHPNTYSHLIQAQQQHQQQQLMMQQQQEQNAIKSEANHNNDNHHHHHHRSHHHHHPHQTPLPHHTISTTASGKPRIWSIADMATGVGAVVAAGGEKPVVAAKPTAAAES